MLCNVDEKAAQREFLGRKRKRMEDVLQWMKKLMEVTEASELLRLRDAVTWGCSQRGVPTEQQSAIAGDNRQILAA